MTLTQSDVHALATRKGWWDEWYGDDVYDGAEMPASLILSRLALVHSEISEAVECARDGAHGLDYPHGPKPEGLVVELADAVIRIMDLCEALGLDLDSAIETKFEYNKTRSHRHGGRLA